MEFEMTLLEWMRREGLDIAGLANRLDCTGEAVRRYTKGARIPDRQMMQRIHAITDGCVAPNDFYGLVSIHRSPVKPVADRPSFGKADEISDRVPA